MQMVQQYSYMFIHGASIFDGKYFTLIHNSQLTLKSFSHTYIHRLIYKKRYKTIYT